MATAKQQENMLLTEHFTWPPISLLDDIINMINEVLYNCTVVLDKELSNADPSVLGFADRAVDENCTPEVDPETGEPMYPEAKKEIEEGMLKLETLVENALDKNFDKLEIWTLRNVFSLGNAKGKGEQGEEDVGRWIKLGHYEDVPTTPIDPSLTPASLQALRRKLQETQTLHAALLAEKTRNEAQIAKLRSLLQPALTTKREPRSSTSPSENGENGKQGGQEAPFAFLTHNPAAQQLGIQTLPQNSTANANATTSTSPPTAQPHSQNPLTTHTQFTTSHLPHLRALLATLRPHLATTALPSQHSGGSKDELAKERKAYIESQSKRILEKRGVDTRDGVEGAVEGIRGGSGSGDEVRALEGLLPGLGRKRQEKREEGEGEAMDLS